MSEYSISSNWVPPLNTYGPANSVFFNKWKNMLARCYDPYVLNKYPSYRDCYVCDEWHSFLIFKLWMEQQDYEGKQLDKDILVPNNKVYSPYTCAFVSHAVNCLLSYKQNRKNKKYPVGVAYYKQNNFMVSISMRGKSIFLGYYPDEWSAAKAYREAKSEHVRTVAMEQSDMRVRDGLLHHAQLIKLGL